MKTMARSKAELEDDLKQRDRRIGDLKRELDEARDLIRRQDEQLQDVDGLIESWKEAFSMTLNDAGLWDCADFFKEADAYHDKYRALLKDWNKLVPEYNATVLKRNVGRPLRASDEQIKAVRKLRKQGMSLRAIADEIKLGLQTVCTILNRDDGVDRTTMKHLQRVAPDMAAERQWLIKQRMREALPKRIAATEKANAELRHEAKGLK
jgi:hypothetical protein